MRVGGSPLPLMRANAKFDSLSHYCVQDRYWLAVLGCDPRVLLEHASSILVVHL